ncbi:MAG TPA: Gfo/Idh/MocA family oxidoreductase [Steroidobacter sp.]|uniref:Gfo/Idh/MocA family protein n=1 Tax=Steroidobacter sp. TaxID=1978227 RepID=UPI002ED8A497
MNHPIRLGILGAARIAAGFVAGARLSQRVEVVAVGSRDAAKAAEFARAHGIERALSYEELLGAMDIDAVYIPLPNSLHAPWSIAALRAGKHVLCEKPLALSEAEALEMFEAADAASVVLLEGYPYLYQPMMQQIERLIAEGAIGEIQTITAACGFTLNNPNDIRLDPSLGGGALLDSGCYPVSFIRQLIGNRPTRVSAVARWRNDVDETLAATLEFASGAIAQVTCSFATGLHRSALIAGSGGIIETEFQNHTIRSQTPSFRLRRGSDWRNPTETIPVPREDGFRLELDAFVDMIEHGDSAARRAASIDNAWTLAEILNIARGVATA